MEYRLKHAQSKNEKLEAILEHHIKFEKIHPFGDGNGRTWRFLIIHSCLKENLIPVIIPKEEKGKYITLLSTEDIQHFTKFAIELQEN